jgi:hypothetical protein
MSAVFQGTDWDVHLVRQVLVRAGRPLPATTIQTRADLCHERTYAALVRMYSGDAVRVLIDVSNQDQGREWELMNAPT